MLPNCSALVLKCNKEMEKKILRIDPKEHVNSEESTPRK